MIPYFVVRLISTALFISIGITAVMLLAFGFGKSVAAGASYRPALYGSLETLLVGAVAASASYGIVRGVNNVFDAKE